MNRHTPDQPDRHEALDALLREWHDDNAERARAQRDQLLASVSASMAEKRARSREDTGRSFNITTFRTRLMTRYMPIAASLALVVTLVALLVPMSAQPVYADGGEVMVPEGGMLEALDANGELIGPCALEHTDVNVDVSGFLSRVTLTQEYHNPYDQKIEAVYTFPMSHRGAVDGFRMIVGDRVVVGEVKEREEARQIYEAAREQGYVASLLEQERPNIFTQSVANIEPGATVMIEISYIEIIEEKDGEHEFSFPMVVGPRYIPGAPTTSHSLVPAELTPRRGVILLGPAQLSVTSTGDADEHGTLQPGKLQALLSSAQAIEYPGEAWWGKGEETGGAAQPALWHRFEASYGDGSKEFGELFADGTGWINGRWFYFDPRNLEDMGTGFAQDTNQVPDASRITPMPVKPPTRAGHDVSLTMTIDTGGPGIVALGSALHDIEGDDFLHQPGEPPSSVTIALANQKEIPNRDFVLTWKQQSETITEATFSHTGAYGEYAGGFFTFILQPPARVDDWPVRPRELVFVMDVSGSMRGLPIEKSKEVITRAIDAMRPEDTFNIITFSGHTSVLWDEPKPATEANRQAAQQFVDSRSGGGGTEMMKAIRAALEQQAPPRQAEETILTAEDLANLPADGRQVNVELALGMIDVRLQDGFAPGVFDVRVQDGITFRVDVERWTLTEGEIVDPQNEATRDRLVRLTGTWETKDGRRVLSRADAVDVPSGSENRGTSLDPMRLVLFLTDGYVGNDPEIIKHVRENAETTRVFSFGIGNSINRHLLDGMAEAGRGEVEYVLLASDADKAVERFTRRIETPVLTDITLEFSDGLEVMDVLPRGERVPDLFDAKPLVIQGRYQPGEQDRTGTLTIRGETGAGPYERTLDVTLSAAQPDHRATATLWARKMVDELTADENVQGVTDLGLAFQIMTKHTSFVAVERSRVTIEGKPVLVAIPVELPDGTQWEGFFGGEVEEDLRDDVIMLGAQLRLTNEGEAGEIRFPWPKRGATTYGFDQDRSGLVDSLSEFESFASLPPDQQAKYAAAVQELKEQGATEDMIHTLLSERGAGITLERASAGLTRSVEREQAETLTMAPSRQSALRRSGDVDELVSLADRKTGEAAGSKAGRAIRQAPAPPPPPVAPEPVAPRSSAGQSPSPQARPDSEPAVRRPNTFDAPAESDGRRRGGQSSQTGAGGGGGFGGGGGGGGGGSIFGDPAESVREQPSKDRDEIAPALTPDERQRLVSSVVREMLFPNDWHHHGGTSLRLDWVDTRPVPVPLEQSEDVLAQAIIVQSFIDAYAFVLNSKGTQIPTEFPSHTTFRETPADVALLEKIQTERVTITFDGATIESMLSTIASTAHVPVTVNWDRLDLIGTTRSDTASVELEDATVASAIVKVLRAFSDELDTAAAIVQDRSVYVSDDLDLRTHRAIHVYDVGDLVSVEVGGNRGLSARHAEALLNAIMELIDPNGWHMYGGDTQHAVLIDNILFVHAPLRTHRQVHALLSTLRVAMSSNESAKAARVPATPMAELHSDDVVVFDVRDLRPGELAFALTDEYSKQSAEDFERGLENGGRDAELRQAFIASRLPELLTTQVKPDRWRINGGGDATLHTWRGFFVVSAAEALQNEVATFLGSGKIEIAPVEAPKKSAGRNWAEQAVTRLDRLAKVLHPELQPIAVGARGAQPADEIPASGPSAPPELRLTLLTTSIDESVIRAIESLGATIEGTSDAGPLVVVTAPKSALWKLAMHDAVRRIEPARVSAE